MKSLLVIAASLFFSSNAQTDALGRPELTDSFSDAIKTVTEEGQALQISFDRHPAVYVVQREHPQFTEIKAKLEKAQKIDQKVKVIAIIPSMTIKEIS